MQVAELYVAELCYLCNVISSESNTLANIGLKKIKQYNLRERFIPWGRARAAEKLNSELAVINANLKFRRELLEKLYSSTGGGEGETLTLLEIMQRGGELI